MTTLQDRAASLFAKEFGQGVHQQRARGKTKENAGTLTLALIYLALSKMRKNGQQPTSIIDVIIIIEFNILEEFQCLQEHTEETEQVCSYSEFLTTREML